MKMMSQRERIAMQRALVREALGKLEAVTEFFGTEDEVDMAAHLHDQAIKDYADLCSKRTNPWGSTRAPGSCRRAGA